MKYAETTEEKVIEARKNTQKMCSINKCKRKAKPR